MLMQKVKKEMTTTPLHTSSQTRRGSAHWNSVTQGGNDNCCTFIIICKLLIDFVMMGEMRNDFLSVHLQLWVFWIVFS